MKYRNVSFCVIVLLACTGTLLSQQSRTQAMNSEQLPIGVWEAEQPDGTVAGIDLTVVPRGIPNAVYPEGTEIPQGSCLQIAVFFSHRQFANRAQNYFLTDWTGAGSENASATYANQRLDIHYRDLQSSFKIDVQLVLDPVEDTWTGRFRRGWFDRHVTLRRHADSTTPARPALLLTSMNSPGLFRVEVSNPSNQNLVLNLGIQLANGAVQYPNAVRYTLTMPDGRVLHLTPAEPAFISGRVDPLIVPLPAGATFSFLMDLNQCTAAEEQVWQLVLPRGRYTLQAEYRGRAVQQSQANLDVKGIALMPYWVGTVTSDPLMFTVEDQEAPPES